MRLLTLAAALALPVGAGAVETASFLNIGVGARELGMGGTGASASHDADALFWNPAGLARLEKSEATAGHAELPQSARHDFLAYAHPTRQGTLAASVTYLSQDAIEGRDAMGHPAPSFQASDAAVSLGLGRAVGIVDVGLAVKYIRSHIGSAEAQTIAVDAGARKALGPITLSAALRNAGPGMKFDSETDDLPLRAALGASCALPGGHALAAEIVNSPRGAGTDVGVGGEYQAVADVFLRAGYTTQGAVTGGAGFDAARGLTLGLGLRRERWSVDYAAVPMGELGSAHRFTLTARW